ncbi:MAG TPA: hypothetical protein VMJ10_00925 [Kofleriaceae bacterium]|nr:hypothetical protein [Kofleriaceae bacterium]
MKSVYAALAAIGIALPAISRADPPLPPMMDPDRPVHCGRDRAGDTWRMQCDDAKKLCLYAPDSELDADGNRVRPLEQVRDCAENDGFDRAAYEKAGYQFIPGRPDAPWGWSRDERGRVFQVNFDLHRRMYFGVGYSPQKIIENPLESTRSTVDFGLLVLDIYDPGPEPTRHRIRLLEGEVALQPFSAEVTLAHYDMSHRFMDPLLRITTFVGEPERHDLHLDLGMFTEAGGLELRQTSYGDTELWKHATAQVTMDLWQSANLESFVRLRTGGILEGQYDPVNGYRSALTESTALDIDAVLDPAGFHNVRFELAHELPRYFTPYAPNVLVQRMHAKLQYETIVLAINDQPLSLHVAAGGEKRNDIPGVPDQWAFVVDAGLRFSLWAPPRPR